MKKLVILCFLLAALDLLGQHTIESPNVVLIYIDDLDFDELGYYNSEILTPNIDSLFEGSIEFKNAYVTSAVCTPSRFSLLTGSFASRSSSLRVYDESELPNIQWNTKIGDHENIASLIGDQIHTGIVGKWHLGTKPINSYQENGDPNNPNIKAKLLEDYISMQQDIKSKGFDYVDALYNGNPKDHDLHSLHFHNVEWVTSKGLEFLNECISSNKQFFLYYSTTVPHSPNPTESMNINEYVTHRGILDSTEILPSGMLTRREIIELANSQRKIKPYMTWLDQGIGALVRRLKQEGIYDNTMIIMMSDHQSRGKFTNYEGTRVPLLIKPAGWDNRHVERFELVANIDILPTILTTVSIGEKGHEFDGKDLSPLFNVDNQEELRTHLLLEIGYSKAIIDNSGLKLMVNKFPSDLLESAIANNRQLMHYGEFYPGTKRSIGLDAVETFPHYFNTTQLYQLQSDPNEQTNLIGNLNYSLDAHNLFNRMKTQLFKLPHSYSEYMGSSFLLKARILNHVPHLKVFEVADSISFLPIDTLLFEKPSIISDTLTFGFEILDSTLYELALDVHIPNWLTLIDTVIMNNEVTLSFLNKKNFSSNESLISISFDNNKKLTYKCYILVDDTLDAGRSSDIFIYPNPTYDKFQVILDQEFQFKLFNLNGNFISIPKEHNTINIERLNSGIYILCVFDMKNQLLLTEKIIKK
jgi:arylsulfatase A-like enzyme